MPRLRLGGSRRDDNPILAKTTKRIKRGAHTIVRQLEADIRSWIEEWNETPCPYVCVWVKTTDEVLASLARYCARVSLDHGAPLALPGEVQLLWRCDWPIFSGFGALVRVPRCP